MYLASSVRCSYCRRTVNLTPTGGVPSSWYRTFRERDSILDDKRTKTQTEQVFCSMKCEIRLLRKEYIRNRWMSLPTTTEAD